MSMFPGRAGLARLAAPFLLAGGLSACSSIPDWVDPTTWFGGGNQTATEDASANADATPPSDAANSTPGQTPDIAGIPAKPTPPSTPDEQKDVANSLAADRSQSQYSADKLQGGTEPPASPPPAAASPASDSEGASSPPAESSSPPSAETNAASPAGTANAGQTAAASPGASAENATPASASGEATSAPPASAPASGVAALPPAPEPADSSAAAAAPTPAPSAAPAPAAETAATFAPSSAPALDPSVAQYVPQTILLRYRQTAAAAAAPGISGESPSTNAASGHSPAKKAKTPDPS